MLSKVLITSGPTIEPIDPVRFLSNRSSGKTGYFLALEAKARQIPTIVFVSGPSGFLPDGVDLIRVETTQEMRRAVRQHARSADVIVMAAAVSDYRSVRYYPEKIKKDGERMDLELIKNPDILRELGEAKGPRQVLVGFAAETEDIFVHAQEKLHRKNLDLLVLNEISTENPAFGTDQNQVYLVTATGIRKLERMEKARIAALVWDEIATIAQAKGLS